MGIPVVSFPLSTIAVLFAHECFEFSAPEHIPDDRLDFLPDSWGAYFRSTWSGTVRGSIRGQL